VDLSHALDRLEPPDGAGRNDHGKRIQHEAVPPPDLRAGDGICDPALDLGLLHLHARPGASGPGRGRRLELDHDLGETRCCDSSGRAC
jgi:hypothetical protein